MATLCENSYTLYYIRNNLTKYITSIKLNKPPWNYDSREAYIFIRKDDPEKNKLFFVHEKMTKKKNTFLKQVKNA